MPTDDGGTTRTRHPPHWAQDYEFLYVTITVPRLHVDISFVGGVSGGVAMFAHTQYAISGDLWARTV